MQIRKVKWNSSTSKVVLLSWQMQPVQFQQNFSEANLTKCQPRKTRWLKLFLKSYWKHLCCILFWNLENRFFFLLYLSEWSQKSMDRGKPQNREEWQNLREYINNNLNNRCSPLNWRLTKKPFIVIDTFIMVMVPDLFLKFTAISWFIKGTLETNSSVVIIDKGTLHDIKRREKETFYFIIIFFGGCW